MSLKNQVITGALWSYGQQFGTQIVQFGVSIILARILSPKDFGLIGMIAIFIALGNAFFEGGLTNSLIRSQNLEKDDFSTVWIFNIIVSFVIYALIFFAAPLIADFYKQDILTSLLRIYSISFIISSFSAVHNTILIKEMQFKKIAVIMLPALIITSLLSIYLAFAGFGVWTLVYASLTNAIFSTIFLWIYVKWKPSFVFKMKKFKYHFGYGSKLMASSVLDIIFTNAYQIIIGKLYNPVMLGYYSRANSLMMLPVINISSSLNKVAFPTFSHMQDEPERLRAAYKKIMLLVLFLVTPILAIMIVLARPLVVFLITEKWLPIVPMFQILCLSGILYPLHMYNLIILQVKGKSDLYLYLEITKKLLVVITVIVSINYGFYGLIWGQVIFSVVALFINTHFAGKFLDYNVFQQFRDILPIFALALVMGLLILCVDFYLLSTFTNFIRLILGTAVGFIFFGTGSMVFKFSSFYEIKKIILKK